MGEARTRRAGSRFEAGLVFATPTMASSSLAASRTSAAATRGRAGLAPDLSAWLPVCATGELPCGRDKHIAVLHLVTCSSSVASVQPPPEEEEDEDEDEDEHETTRSRRRQGRCRRGEGRRG